MITVIEIDLATTVGLSASKRQLFEQLVQKHQRYLYNIAYRMTGNVEEAQDLAQETLVKAYRAFGRFEPGTSFERWLYRIMANLYIDYVRKKSNRPLESLDASYDGEQGGREVPDSTNDPGTILEHTVLHGEVQKALEALPAQYRLAVILCDLQDFSYEEIAQILNCSIGTVRSRIHRGRRMLREALEEYGQTHNWPQTKVVECP